MIKIAIFDSGYGGEAFADCLENEINVVETIRVIDWRHAEIYQTNPRMARSFALEALQPYIGKVDLIVLANHLLSITSLKYFRRKYPQQKFLGLELKSPDTFVKRDVLILATKAVTKTMEYHGFIFGLKRKVKTLTADQWLSKIDDGELTQTEIDDTLLRFINHENIKPGEVILACSHFQDIIPNLKKSLGYRTRIYSSFDDAIRETCKTLRIRGGARKIK